MTVAWPTGVGAVIAVLVVVFAVLGLAGVLPPSPTVVFALLLALGIARLT